MNIVVAFRNWDSTFILSLALLLQLSFLALIFRAVEKVSQLILDKGNVVERLSFGRLKVNEVI